ncbi:MAG: UDP-N-acetylmuramoyl-L-alanyl-D-glutamate--2,6-diaminopimelate ligase [Nitrospirae bacterium]|nr:UDP-N-acetylmuramoyl-L-alanyl-D-glutamate--2,6-diaminopimelate ligase [Nitrospirota bacterium]
MLIKDMNIKSISGSTDIEVSGIGYDSRKIAKGDVFIALKGEKFDGHDFIGDAVKNGAGAVVYEKVISNVKDELTAISSQLTAIKVKDSREALACISNNFYERPSARLKVIGVTGTNGKTTTTYLLKSILESWGREVGLIGTISYLVREKQYAAPHTTPEAPDFQRILQEMALLGCSHVVTEVSSHALAQRRVDCTNFDVAVFTNLTRDHLDFHITMEDYFIAKKRLFEELLSEKGTAVINFDDLYGMRLHSEFMDSEFCNKNFLTYGIETKSDLNALNIKDSFEGLVFDISFRDMIYRIESPLVGLYNVYNILSAAGAAVALDVPWDSIREGVRKLDQVKGRFEKVDCGQDFLCIVDYAHTEDALERLIKATRKFLENIEIKRQGQEAGSRHIITVFGCGGNRDRGKRPRMGAIATRLSDYVVITSDNPRNEDPLEIIREIQAGTLRRNYIIEPDREKAIRRAIDIAEKGDIVLIAGKGHEDYQEIKGIRYRFSDREIIERTAKER